MAKITVIKSAIQTIKQVRPPSYKMASPLKNNKGCTNGCS